MSTTTQDVEDRTAEQVADHALLAAIRTVADTVATIGTAAGELVVQIAHEEKTADALTVAAAATHQLGQSADLFAGIGVGLAEMRQRVLAGADRTIRVEGDGSAAS